MEKLCENLQLMTEGAVEAINDWAFDNVDAPLIDDGSTVYIDLEVAEENSGTPNTEAITMTKRSRIKTKERDSIIQSLKAGVVPRTGIQHIQVGRAKEIEAIFKDINRIAQGGSAFRLIIGEYGSGKTFFLNVIRSIALEKKTGGGKRGPVT